ncbi:MAG TPA: type II toxin-antitoxin system HicB family antitoxin [Solirubrobacteraceae bacterium]|nr:type II toxin-antitoxin system HicB family antitoxin [Solirubrobacteraceae bacterium]
MASTLSNTYVAEVQRDESGNWIAAVPALRGVHTHARTLASLRTYLQDAIALWLEVDRLDAGERNPQIDREGISVELRVKLPAPVRRATDSARLLRERAKSAEAAAATSTRDAARALVGIGLSRRDAAELLGLSHQRVDQVLRSA